MIRASSDAAFRRLIGQFIAFYASSLLNPHWGDVVTLQRNNTLTVRMTFQGLDRQQAHAVWQPFLGGVVASGSDLSFTMAPRIVEIPARRLWDPAYLRARNGVLIDDRSGAPADNRATTIWHTAGMPDDHSLTSRRADQLRTDVANVESGIEVIMGISGICSDGNRTLRSSNILAQTR